MEHGAGWTAAVKLPWQKNPEYCFDFRFLHSREHTYGCVQLCTPGEDGDTIQTTGVHWPPPQWSSMVVSPFLRCGTPRVLAQHPGYAGRQLHANEPRRCRDSTEPTPTLAAVGVEEAIERCCRARRPGYFDSFPLRRLNFLCRGCCGRR